jgi:hypothetical protein
MTSKRFATTVALVDAENRESLKKRFPLVLEIKHPPKDIGSEDQPMEQVDGDDDHFRMTSFSSIKCAMLI